MSRGAESSGGGSSSGNQQPETELDPFFNCRRIDRDTVGLTVLVPGGFIIKEEFNPGELFYNIKEKIFTVVTRWPLPSDATKWLEKDLYQDRIWKRIRDENCFKHLKLKKKSDPNELREIRKSDLRFRGVKTNSSELYEFSEHEENLSLAQMQLFSFQLRFRPVPKYSFSIGLDPSSLEPFC